jgi:hypothetical protein
MNSNSLVALISSGSTAEVVSPWGPPRQSLETLENLKPGFGQAPLISGVEMALNLFHKRPPLKGPAALHEIHILSDFQNDGLREFSKISLPGDIQIHFHTLDQSTVKNVSLALDFNEKAIPPKARVEIKNHSENPIETRLHFTTDSQLHDPINLTMEGLDRQWFDFTLSASEPGWHTFSAQLEVDDDADFDNRAQGSFKKHPPCRVLCVHRTKNPNYSDPLIYLNLAMNGGDGMSDEVQSSFNMKFLSAAELLERLKFDLAQGVDLIIFPGLNDDIPGVGEYLLKYAESGGGLLFFAGPNVWASKYNENFSDVLPARFGKNITADNYQVKTTSISKYDKDHPIFSLFRKNDSGDLSHPVFTGWNELRVSPESVVPAAFDNDIPMLVCRNFGRGISAILNTSVDDAWSDWPKRRTFLPVIQELGFYLCHRPADMSRGSYLVDDRIILTSPDHVEIPHQTCTPQEGETIQRPVDPNGSAMWRFDLPGLYRVDLGGDESAQVAINTHPGESDWKFSDSDKLNSLIVRGNQLMDTQSNKAGKNEFWKWLLAVGILLLIAEMLIANRFAT